MGGMGSGAIQWLYRKIFPRILLSPPEGARASVFAACCPLHQLTAVGESTSSPPLPLIRSTYSVCHARVQRCY